jgi:hypothetical protein
MEVADKSTTSPIDRRHVNQCRLYLKVQRLSDLCNGAGTEFLPEALSHTYPSHNIKSNFNWPRQGYPSDRTWVTWKRILRRLFLADKAGPLRSMKLSIPLGDWMIDTSSADTSWPYYYDTNTGKAYKRFLDGYWPMLRVRPYSRNLYKFSNDHTDTVSLSHLPTTATPATLKTRTTTSVTLSISSSSNHLPYCRPVQNGRPTHRAHACSVSLNPVKNSRHTPSTLGTTVPSSQPSPFPMA